MVAIAKEHYRGMTMRDVIIIIIIIIVVIIAFPEL